jgi:hypothetical protein
MIFHLLWCLEEKRGFASKLFYENDAAPSIGGAMSVAGFLGRTEVWVVSVISERQHQASGRQPRG